MLENPWNRPRPPKIEFMVDVRDAWAWIKSWFWPKEITEVDLYDEMED